MLIRNPYLDKCISGEISFSVEEFNKTISEQIQEYSTHASSQLVRECLTALIKEHFKDDLQTLKKKSEINYLKMAVLKGVNIYEQLFYIFAAITSIQKVDTCRLLGQKDLCKNDFFDLESLSNSEVHDINKRLIDLGIVSLD